MIISDMVTTKKISKGNINDENWCSCINGTLTKKNYLQSIMDTRFQNIQILNENLHE